MEAKRTGGSRERRHSSGAAVLAAWYWITRQGAKPVPLRHQSKAAQSQGYEKDGWEPPDVTIWRQSELGIGVKTGPREKGPIDADLDCHEAVFFAPRFLPVTQAVFGRATKPASHYFYFVDVEEFAGLKLIDPIDRSMIIELRGDGGNQTVCPGSLHETTGEEITFQSWQGAFNWRPTSFGPEGPDISHAALDDIIKGAKRAAIATLITRHLWNEGSRNNVTNHLSGLFFYLGWPIEDVISVIEAVMEHTGDDDKTRRMAVTNTYKKGARGAKVTGATKLKEYMGKALDPVIDRLLEWAGAPDTSFMSEYNERFAVVPIEGKFRIADFAVDAGEQPIFFQRDDFLHTFATDKLTIVDDAGNEKKLSKAALWLASPKRRSYNRLDFLPGVEDADVLNLWTGWAIEPSPAPRPEAFQAWRRLVLEVICDNNKARERWLLNWLCNIVREPTVKPLTAPVIIGPQGAGKSLAIGYFAKCLGLAYIPVTEPEHIYGRFNQHLATCLLLHSEEALYAGDRKHAAIIKSLITDEYRMFEPKNVNAKRVRNFLRLVLTSNTERAAPIEAGDRRYTVFNLNNRKAPRDLIRDVLTEMRADGPAALFHFLLHQFEYDGDLARENVKDEAFFAVRQLNYTPIEEWWAQTLEQGELLPDYLSWGQYPTGADGHPWPAVVSSDALWRSYAMYASAMGFRKPESQYALALELNKMTGRKLDRNKRRLQYINPWRGDVTAPPMVRDATERPASISNMPTLLECRTAFEAYIGRPIEWGEPETEVEKGEPPHARWKPRVVNKPEDKKKP